MIDAIAERLLATHIDYRTSMALILRGLTKEELDQVHVMFDHSNLSKIDLRFGLVAAHVRHGIKKERERRAAEAAQERQA